MNSLPKEILRCIFSLLSQRSRFRCSLVCKDWYHVVTGNPFFYRTIHISSMSQLEAFINMATTIKMKNNFVSHFVQQLIFEGDFWASNKLNVNMAEKLHRACPNIIYVNGLPSSYYKHFQDWKMYHIENWYLEMDLNWFYQLQHQLTSLHMDVDKIMTKTSSLNNKDSNKVQFIIDQIQSKQTPPHDYDNELIDENGYLHYFGKVLSIPVFNQLKILILDFSTSFNSSSLNIYEIDERTLVSIHQSCPLLEDLTLVALFMNVSESTKTSLSLLSSSSSSLPNTNHHYNHNNQTDQTDQVNKLPINYLKSLTLKWCILNQTQCYDCFSKMYPYLTSLKMGLKWYSDSDKHDSGFQVAIYNMITSFKYLKNLIIENISEFASGRPLPMYSNFWPHELLFNWLNQYPQRLDVFKYPYDFTSIKKDHLTNTTTTVATSASDVSGTADVMTELLNPSFLFLNYLTTLEFNIGSDFEKVLLIFLKSGNKNKVSTTISTLKIHREGYHQDSFPILVWLDTFPKLKHLTLNGIHPINTDIVVDQEASISSGLLKYRHHCSFKDIPSLPSYSLESLQIQNSSFYSKHDLTAIGLVCPKLRELDLYLIDINTGPKGYTLINFSIQKTKDEKSTLKNVDEKILIDTPHLTLDYLSLNRCGIVNTSYSRMADVTGVINNFTVNESNTTYQFKKKITDYNRRIELVLNCKSIDTIIIH
ncbi:unnamed protein product [Cunninghamella blakesleeana]